MTSEPTVLQCELLIIAQDSASLLNPADVAYGTWHHYDASGNDPERSRGAT